VKKRESFELVMEKRTRWALAISFVTLIVLIVFYVQFIYIEKGMITGLPFAVDGSSSGPSGPIAFGTAPESSPTDSGDSASDPTAPASSPITGDETSPTDSSAPSSSGGGSGGTTREPSAQLCGNKVVDEGEECDGDNFGQYGTGTIGCSVLNSQTLPAGPICTQECKEAFKYNDEGSLTCTGECKISEKYCQISYCGDGVVQTPNGAGIGGGPNVYGSPGFEECDDGNSNNNDNCIIDLANQFACVEAYCGDGYVKISGCLFLPPGSPNACEECDDGNTENGDGCSSKCAVEFGTGTIEHTECVNQQCVIVPGSGENQCESNEDCISKPTTPTPGSGNPGTPSKGTTSSGSTASQQPTAGIPGIPSNAVKSTYKVGGEGEEFKEKSYVELGVNPLDEILFSMENVDYTIVIQKIENNFVTILIKPLNEEFIIEIGEIRKINLGDRGIAIKVDQILEETGGEETAFVTLASVEEEQATQQEPEFEPIFEAYLQDEENRAEFTQKRSIIPETSLILALYAVSIVAVIIIIFFAVRFAPKSRFSRRKHRRR